MYKYIIAQAGDVDWMALGPLLLFFIFFTAITIMALSKKKEYVDKMSSLPLDQKKELK
ncbi:MAG: hypothetical protein AAFP19_16460 [Bacteroidota bacterium]